MRTARRYDFLAMALPRIIGFILIYGAADAINLLQSDSAAADLRPLSPTALGVCSRRDPAMNPFYEIRYGQDVVWQIPPAPKAVLFLAHGRDRELLSLFDRGPHCLQCYGFPEERAAVLEALDRSYAIIAVKNVEGMWQPSEFDWPPPPSLDRTIVVRIIREWTKEHALEHLPVVAFGYSNGGNFTSILTLDLAIQSMVMLCSPGEFPVLNHADASWFPPTLFASMTRDNGPFGFYTMAQTAVRILRSRGVLADEIDIRQSPIHAHSLSDKIPCLERSTSERIYAAYKAEGWLDEQDYWTKDPYLFDWQAVLWRHKLLPVCERAGWWSAGELCFEQHVKQEILTAWAFHAFSSAVNDVVFDWLDRSLNHVRGPLPLDDK